MVKLDFDTRLDLTDRRKHAKVQAILKEIDDKIMRECTFKPVLTKKSIQMMEPGTQFRGTSLLNHKADYETKLKIYSEHSEYKKAQIKLKDSKELVFQPLINKKKSVSPQVPKLERSSNSFYKSHLLHKMYASLSTQTAHSINL